ncbi:MAG: hypothetical protein QG665_116 [Patescibacteria group bacterium]|nr:hypothetical protein [Patescibacteria group bacterium]
MPEDGRPSLTEVVTAVLVCDEHVFVKECELRLRPPQYMGYDVGVIYPYVSKGTPLAVLLCEGIAVSGVLADEIIPSAEGIVTVRLNISMHHMKVVVFQYATPQNGWVVLEIEETAVA